MGTILLGFLSGPKHISLLCPLVGVEGIECSLPMDGRQVSLSQLSQDSFRECQITLTLTDLLIIIFSGISVSVVAIMTSFFLASMVHCFQRTSKTSKGDEEESEEWDWLCPWARLNWHFIWPDRETRLLPNMLPNLPPHTGGELGEEERDWVAHFALVCGVFQKPWYGRCCSLCMCGKYINMSQWVIVKDRIDHSLCL